MPGIVVDLKRGVPVEVAAHELLGVTPAELHPDLRVVIQPDDR